MQWQIFQKMEFVNVKNLVMAIRRIFGPDSDSGFLKESVKKSGGFLADSGFLFLADSGFGFRILAVF